MTRIIAIAAALFSGCLEQDRCHGTALERYNEAWARCFDGEPLRDCDFEAIRAGSEALADAHR